MHSITEMEKLRAMEAALKNGDVQPLDSDVLPFISEPTYFLTTNLRTGGVMRIPIERDGSFEIKVVAEISMGLSVLESIMYPHGKWISIIQNKKGLFADGHEIFQITFNRLQLRLYMDTEEKFYYLLDAYNLGQPYNQPPIAEIYRLLMPENTR